MARCYKWMKCKPIIASFSAARRFLPRFFPDASRLEPFYTFPLEVARLSGTVDTINVLLREELLPELKPSRAGLIRIAGEVRSFNNHSGEGSKLVISVFARELSPPETPVWVNEVELTGTLCESPNRRTTPNGSGDLAI